MCTLTNSFICIIFSFVDKGITEAFDLSPEASQDVLLHLFFRFQNGKKMVYLPLLFVDELSNRVKDLVVSSYILKYYYVTQQK